MDFIQAIIFGVVEGVTEFLPVSSTGHLILLGQLLHVPEDAFTKSFEIIIQLGAIASVVILYWRSFLNPETLKKLAVAFIPTGIIGLAFYKIVKTYLIGNESTVLWALALGGAALIIFELWYKEPNTAVENSPDIRLKPTEDGMFQVGQVSYKQATLVGVFQAIAIVPGVSRSAATIIGGLIVGLKRSVVVEFSFLLAVPTMLAATGLDLMKNYSDFSVDQFGVLSVGFVVSFVVALGSIKFLLRFIKGHNFILFGVYRIVVALLFWAVIL
ncbi:MAG: undecaprenyl-diphosphate phosphatase [bacterium]|nr:undecaprenyl-diphosphate phosphatase [bacterium]